jgi:uncharacterized membrane protein
LAEQTPAKVEPRFAPGHESEGRPAALIAWGLYLLAVPTGCLSVFVGVIAAYAGRGGSDGLSRAHIDAQIGLFWSVFWWTILLWVGFWACVVGVFAVPVMAMALVPLSIVVLLGLLFLTVWFTIKSLIGLFRLLGDKTP